MNLKILISISAFSLYTLSFSAQAQDCGEIKDGAVSRLDEPGRSLANSRVQDQDGLGTCYANSASLMLQSALPNNPDISYLHLSINRAERLVQKEYRSQGKTQALKDNGDLLVDAGFSCESIKLAKENGGVCERKNVALEQMMFRTDVNQFSDPSWAQLDLLKKVSTYYDGMLRDFSTPAKPEEKKSRSFFSNESSRAPGKYSERPNSLESFFSRIFGTKPDAEAAPVVDNENQLQPVKEESNPAPVVPVKPKEENEKFVQYRELLKKVIDENRDKYAKKICEKVDTTNSLKVAQNLLMRIQNNVNANKYKKFPPSRYKLFQLKIGFAFDMKVNGVPVVEAKVDDKFKKALEDHYLKQLTNESRKPESAEQAFKETLYKIDPAAPKKMIDDLVADFSADDKELLNADYKRYALKDYSSCAPNAKMDYLKNDDGLVKDFTGAGCPSSFVKHVKNLQQMIIGLDKYNFDNIDRINDFISNLPSLSYDKAMMQLLAPGCSEDKKIKIPKEVSCQSKRFSYPGSRDDDDATTERHLASMRKEFMSDSLKSINGNKAVGLSMCTGFYSQEGASEFYTKTNLCDATKKHGFHAVTMIGYKCERGKMKYLIQNSWGAWDTANGRFEKDSHGKAWMGEDELIKNTYQLDIMD